MNRAENKQPPPKGGDAFKRVSAWARPRAMARDTNVSAWLALLGFICLAIALWTPVSRIYWNIRNRGVVRNDAVARNSSCFLAISYEGISQNIDPSGRFIAAQDFRAHLAALKGAGYHPIRLEDVRAFYEEKKPLPQKALLLTFENTRKSTFFEGRSILEEFDWCAVMGVVTKRVDRKDRDTILWPYLQSMSLDARWDLASESHSGTGFITANAQGFRAPFYATRQWLFDENRAERLDEFQARIEEDHNSSIADFTARLRQKPQAFFFPLGNYGQFDQGGRALRNINLDVVGKLYPLGFILNNQALNEATTDRRRLNRASIPASMSPEELVAMLDNAWPLDSAEDFGTKPVKIERWNADWGLLERENGAFTLRARPADDQRFSDADATIGARAWLSGSSQFRDGTFETRFELLRGDLHVDLRHKSDESWVRVAVSEHGTVTIRQAIQGSEPETLAETAISSDTDFRSSHNLFVTMRGGIIYVRFDGKTLFGGAIRLRVPPGGEIESGLIGIGVQSNEPGLAQSHIRESFIRPRLNGMISWPASMSRDFPYVLEQLSEVVFRYTVIAPPWMDVFAGSQISFPEIDNASLRVIAGANSSRIFPAITLHAEASFPNRTKADLVNLLVDTEADGIFIDASDFPTDRLAMLKTWIDELTVLLSARNLALAVRFPASVARLESLLQTFAPGENRLLVDDGSGHPPGIDPLFVLDYVNIQPPAEESQVLQALQISEYDESAEDAMPETESLRRKGYQAYAEGEYAEATNHWGRWCRGDPGNAEPWMLYGHALARLPDPEAAVKAYQVSLQLNPGQIDLMVECARLYDVNGYPEKAEELLDTYARAFPDDPKIAIAQASWLERHGKRSAARQLLTALIARRSNDIHSRLALHNLLDEPADRYLNMHALLKLGSGGPSRMLAFGHDIASSEILTMPEASVFFDFIRETAESGPTEAVRSLYAGFIPPATPITESFDASRLSDRWEARGTTIAAITGNYNLQAAADMAEAYLRLLKSELIRDGFIEVHISESVGAFWLYARRSARAMVRFGFEDDGYIRVQSWEDGEIRTGDSISWIRPTGDFTMRLEVRGDGAMGYIDGRPMFNAPLMIPRKIAYGWWSIAPYSPELGSARARVGLISAGPLNPGIVLMRETDPEKIANDLDGIRPNVRHVSALAPVLFEQTPDGTVPITPLVDFMPLKIYASYHRLRLVPAISLDYYSDINPDLIIKIIEKHSLNGIALLVRTMPGERWFDKMTTLLETTDASLMVIQREAPIFGDVDPPPEENVATIREIQRGSVLIQPNERIWQMATQDYHDWNPGGQLPSASPQLVLLRDKPREMEKPEAHEEPEKPKKPESPDKPDTLDNPENPENPDNPEIPEKPDNPELN